MVAVDIVEGLFFGSLVGGFPVDRQFVGKAYDFVFLYFHI